MGGLGDLPGGNFYSRATGVNADGAVVVGESDSASGIRAFLWTPDLGMVDLREHLLTLGITGLDGWSLDVAFAVSADGRTIVGVGLNPQDQAEAWAAYLGAPPCPADFNGDGAADSNDFFAFLDAFFALNPSADFNNDGAADSNDFFAFLAAFFEGCA